MYGNLIYEGEYLNGIKCLNEWMFWLWDIIINSKKGNLKIISS